MPPKKTSAPAGPSKKVEAKKKERVIEDKTFGLKNKKGGKAQKFIAQVEKQVAAGGDPKNRKKDLENAEARKKKAAAILAEEEEKKLLGKAVMKAQTVDSGVDPKSVYCAFFKAGLCKKGDKCKFSHDPAVERKSAKRNLYDDDKPKEDTMDEWDDEKLAEVVSAKHGSEKSNQTDIICKHFLDAVESNKYGWFWNCPNGGGNCMYKHAIPAGFVLNRDKKKAEANKGEEISLEELIERRRSELGARLDLIPVTLQSFVQWKKRKMREKAAKEVKEAGKKKEKFISGVKVGLSGREMFTFDPNMMSHEDDDEGGEAFDLSKMDHDGEEEEVDDGIRVHEIKFDEYGIMDDGLDDSTVSKLKAGSVAAAGGGATVAIDEDLFEDEDLDDLEDDLANLDV